MFCYLYILIVSSFIAITSTCAFAKTALIQSAGPSSLISSPIKVIRFYPKSSSEIDSASVEFVRDAALCNRMHIQQALLAKEHTQNKTILNLADILYFHHQKIDAELKGIASAKGIKVNESMPVEKLAEINKLYRLKGAAFDKEYIRMMENSHRKAINFYKKGIAKSLDNTIKAFASRSLSIIEAHYETIKRLNKSI